MTKSIHINPTLFRNIDFQKLDYEKNARQVFERVITRGSLSDWFEIKSYYGKDRIKAEIVKIRSLDKVTFNFCSTYFRIL
jgi:hypothetical protein